MPFVRQTELQRFILPCARGLPKDGAHRMAMARVGGGRAAMACAPQPDTVNANRGTPPSPDAEV